MALSAKQAGRNVSVAHEVERLGGADYRDMSFAVRRGEPDDLRGYDRVLVMFRGRQWAEFDPFRGDQDFMASIDGAEAFVDDLVSAGCRR